MRPTGGASPSGNRDRPVARAAVGVLPHGNKRTNVVTEKIFETALGVNSSWFIAGMAFHEKQRTLSIRVDFQVGSPVPCRDWPGSIRSTAR